MNFSSIKNLSVMKDARDYQLMVLVSMLIYGLVWLKLDLNLIWMGFIISAALLSQIIATRLWKLPRFEWKSAMISGLSLCILMKCSSLPLSLLLACCAIFSKFIFRMNKKHIFNPTNFALSLGILIGQATVNPGQWGNEAILAFLILCMGIFVTNKACRFDVSLAFILTYAVSLFAHSMWIGESLANPAKRLQTGSLLIFTFFMISDPRSTPNSRLGRIIFGSMIGLAGIYLQLSQGIGAGFILALVFISISTPLIDRFLPGELFSWNQKAEAVPAP